MEEIVHDAMELLCSSNKLQRDKGISELEKLLATESTQDSCLVNCLQKYLVNRLMDSESSWAVKFGCLLAAKKTVSFSRDDELSYHVQTLATQLLTDQEDRVRIAAGQVLGEMCNTMGPHIVSETKEYIMKLIRDNLAKMVEGDNLKLIELECQRVGRPDNSARSPFYRSQSFDSCKIALETTGWKNLETSLEALKSVAKGCGKTFVPFIDEELLALIFKTMHHDNQFLRESGFQICATILQCNTFQNEDLSIDPLSVLGHQLSQNLANGLSDSSPQVRLAASVATRQFLITMPDEPRHSFYPQLLPRMCLNRYYFADGVRIYSQETWRQVTGAAGKELVQRYIGPTVEYYQSATTSENQGVREAACACIAELASKISSSAVSPYVDTLLATLLENFRDDCWAVRDAACLACGNFIASFPDESKASLSDLYPMFYRNLGDSIGSVRQGAAAALCNVVRAYGEPALTTILERVAEGLEEMNKADATDKSLDYQAVPIKRTREDVSGMQSNAINSEHPMPWEFADGCVHLIGELSSNKEAHLRILGLLPSLKASARHKHYPQHVVLLETICKQIPIIGKNLGKKTFSTVVEQFFDEIFCALESENSLTSSAASQCVNQLAAILGQNVLRAKVENYHPRYLAAMESVIYVAPF